MRGLGSAKESDRGPSSDGLPVHFWVPYVPDRAFHAWAPDLEPNQYTTGTSHGVLELYKRLEQRGRAVRSARFRRVAATSSSISSLSGAGAQ